MRESLRDQLLKAGLVDTKKAEQQAREQREQKKAQVKQAKTVRKPQRKTVVVDDAQKARTAAEKALQARRDRDRDIARSQRLAEERKALKAQVAMIVDRHKLPRDGGEIAYNFVDAKKVKHIYVTADIRDGLSRGQLDIVRTGELYSVVKADIAAKIRALDGNAVVARKDRSVADAEAEYADHPIPDDLDW